MTTSLPTHGHQHPTIGLATRLAMLAAVSVTLSAGLVMPASASEDLQTEVSETKSSLSLHQFADRTSELALRAIGMAGIQYKYGGNTPEGGLDCSGLVRLVYKEAWGLDLPRTSEEISRVGRKVRKEELQPGDLVFYNTLRRTFSHVGIYLGDNKFIHAPSPGGEVRIERMDVGYWKSRFNGARRIPDPEQ